MNFNLKKPSSNKNCGQNNNEIKTLEIIPGDDFIYLYIYFSVLIFDLTQTYLKNTACLKEALVYLNYTVLHIIVISSLQLCLAFAFYRSNSCHIFSHCLSNKTSLQFSAVAAIGHGLSLLRLLQLVLVL